MKSGKTTNEKTKRKNFLFKRSSDACISTHFSKNQQKSDFKEDIITLKFYS